MKSVACRYYFSYAERAYAGTRRWSRYHRTPRCRGVSMAMLNLNLVEGAGSSESLCTDSILRQPWGVKDSHMGLMGWSYRDHMAGFVLTSNHCQPESNARLRRIQRPGNCSCIAKGLEDFRQHHSFINTVRHARYQPNLVGSFTSRRIFWCIVVCMSVL